MALGSCYNNSSSDICVWNLVLARRIIIVSVCLIFVRIPLHWCWNWTDNFIVNMKPRKKERHPVLLTCSVGSSTVHAFVVAKLNITQFNAPAALPGQFILGTNASHNEINHEWFKMDRCIAFTVPYSVDYGCWGPSPARTWHDDYNTDDEMTVQLGHILWPAISSPLDHPVRIGKFSRTKSNTFQVFLEWLITDWRLKFPNWNCIPSFHIDCNLSPQRFQQSVRVWPYMS